MSTSLTLLRQTSLVPLDTARDSALARAALYGSSLVDNALYSHFPVLMEGFDVLGALYHYGRNHGQSDTAAICASQTPAAGGTQNLTINGNETAGGVVTGVLGETKVTITSAGNDTARTFSVTGISNGSPVVRSGFGGNAATVTLVGNIDPNSITSVTVDGNTAGAVTVGLERIAGDIAYKYSEDGGATWSSRIVLGDGMTDGQTLFYYPALGRRKDGSLIAIFAGLDVTTGVRTNYQTTSFTGKDDWTPLQVMTINGSTGTANGWYGQIKTLPSGDLVASKYTGDDNFVVVSDDWRGKSWTSHLIVNSSSPDFTEQAIAIIDENNWLCLLRADGVTGMRTCKTVDRGVTWSVPVETNLPASSGYQSHELNTIDVDGTRYVIMTYMARNAGTPPPLIETICARWTTATLALAAATNWGGEVSLVTGLADRSGYPSVFINPDSGNALMAYGKETAARFSEVRTIAVDFAARISAWVENPFLNYRVEDDRFVSTIPLPANAVGFGFMSFGNVQRTAMFAWDTIGTPELTLLVEGSSSAIIDATTGALTGTTGVDTHITLSIDAGGKIYFENRVGSGANLTLHLNLGRR